MINRIITCITSLLAFLLISCSSDDDYIKTYKVYKDRMHQILDELESQSEFYWEKPDSWIQFKGSAMRLASFQVPFSSGYGELSISVLDKDGGGVELNVNRWRKQLGMEPQSILQINNSSTYHINELGQYQIFRIINKSSSDMAYICAIMNVEGKSVFDY